MFSVDLPPNSTHIWKVTGIPCAGGKPSKGTPADKRLGTNKPKPSAPKKKGY